MTEYKKPIYVTSVFVRNTGGFAAVSYSDWSIDGSPSPSGSIALQQLENGEMISAEGGQGASVSMTYIPFKSVLFAVATNNALRPMTKADPYCGEE